MSRVGILYAALLAGALCLCGCQSTPEQPRAGEPEYVHAFYYNWYGNPDIDGYWRHWNHQVILREGMGARHQPPDDIGASFYPALGLYSSSSPQTAAVHMAQLRLAGAGVAVVTWWGVGDYTDKNLDMLFDAAAAHDIKVAFHIEPFPGRNAETTREALVYLLDRFGAHPALYRDPRFGSRPMIYLYDSYLVPAQEWARLFAPDGGLTVRGTPYDVAAIGLWVKEDDGQRIAGSHFDGFYTYFAVDGFTYGSTLAHWGTLAEWAREHDKLFIPSVGPGYHDLRVRPWNQANVRSREEGAYYDRMFEAAIAAAPPVVSVTSFNEWHEGTQIEPSVPKKTNEYTYLDYAPHEPDWYLTRTREWVRRWRDE